MTSPAAWLQAHLYNDEAAGLAAPSRELAFRLLYVRRPGAGVRRLFTPGRKVGGLLEEARRDIRIRGGHCKFQQGCRLLRQIFLARHSLVPRTTRYASHPIRLRTAADSVPGKSTKVNLRAGRDPRLRLHVAVRPLKLRWSRPRLAEGITRRPGACRFPCG